MINRRSFLLGAISLVATPSIVKAEWIMPVTPIDRIGDIRAIVGKIPDGWLECHGGWIVHQSFKKLGKKLNNASAGKIFLPNLTEKAIAERRKGLIIGRYFIYAGDEAVEHAKSLTAIIQPSLIREQGEEIRTVDFIQEWKNDRNITSTT